MTPRVPDPASALDTNDSTRGQWRRHADRMWEILASRREGWLRDALTAEDSTSVEWAVQSANLMRQAALGNETMRVSVRDSFMAENMAWALGRRDEGARVVVWAHDAHVSRGGHPQTSFYRGATMGAYLSQKYGDDLRVFGLETYTGEYTATPSLRDRRPITAAAYPAPVGSVEEAMHRAARQHDSPFLITDLRPARTEPGAAWMRERRPIRSIGYGAYDYGFEQRVVVLREFDALIFIDVTSASKVLR